MTFVVDLYLISKTVLHTGYPFMLSFEKSERETACICQAKFISNGSVTSLQSIENYL